MLDFIDWILAVVSFSLSLLPSLPPDLTPEEKARGLARAIRKQTGEVRERWERLKGHVGGWHSQVERALERLQELQSSMDQLDLRLTQAEEAKASWQPVGDLLIDSLQDHIEKTVVSLTDTSQSTSIIKISSQQFRFSNKSNIFPIKQNLILSFCENCCFIGFK